MPAIVPDYYLILEVDPYADQETIEAAFRRLALLFHPDLNRSAEANSRMQLINEAYSVLRQPAKRERYHREWAVHYSAAAPNQRAPFSASAAYSQSRPSYPPPPPVQPTAAQASAGVDVDEQMLVFYLENSAYGLCLERLQGVIMMLPISEEPRLPRFMEGTIKTRGMTVPVMNLRRFFGMSPLPVTRDTRILLTNIGGELSIGLIVDSVGSFIRIPRSAIEHPPAITADSGINFIRGIAKNGFQLIVMLEPLNFFSPEQREALSV
ncbi:MAG: DnaJ domain-containing protein [Anaerolineae bacterium]|nr:DnaJ domain-containing protein [Anaerolineae bacterium]